MSESFGHMVSCRFIMQHASLHPQCLQSWIKSARILRRYHLDMLQCTTPSKWAGPFVSEWVETPWAIVKHVVYGLETSRFLLLLGCLLCQKDSGLSTSTHMATIFAYHTLKNWTLQGEILVRSQQCVSTHERTSFITGCSCGSLRTVATCDTGLQRVPVCSNYISQESWGTISPDGRSASTHFSHWQCVTQTLSQFSS